MQNRTQAFTRSKKRLFAYCVTLSWAAMIASAVGLNAQCGSGNSANTAGVSRIDAEIQRRYDEKNWNEVVQLAATLPSRSADANFAYGMALAHLARWQDARAALLAGRRECPLQERFPVELGGVAFQLKRNPEAAHWLRIALHLNPDDEYANNFAGTVYLLMGNTRAALKYWNRIEKPQIAQLSFDPQLRIRRLILDRAFAFSPAAMLHLRDYETTEARLNALGIFSAYKIQLDARTNEGFEVQFHATERDGFGSGVLESLISTFSGAAYETVYPAYYNINGSAANVEALLRWDSQKRRAWLSASTPLHNRPNDRIAFQLDARDENWAIRGGFKGVAPVLGSFDLERQSAMAFFTAIPNGRLQWSAGAELSNRSFHNIAQGTALTAALVTPGFALKAIGKLQSTTLEIPERRFTITTAGSSELARMWPSHSNAAGPHLFGKLQGSATSDWFPHATDDVYELEQRIRVGRIFKSAPVDELYLIGIERDTDLWLRGHVGTRDGRKGSSPLASTYFLSNSDFLRRIYANGLISLKAGPLFDIARTTAPTSGLAGMLNSQTTQWFYDAGAQVKLTVLGTSVVFTWGHDLRTGNNAIYGTAMQR